MKSGWRVVFFFTVMKLEQMQHSYYKGIFLQREMWFRLKYVLISQGLGRQLYCIINISALYSLNLLLCRISEFVSLCVSAYVVC